MRISFFNKDLFKDLNRSLNRSGRRPRRYFILLTVVFFSVFVFSALTFNYLVLRGALINANITRKQVIVDLTKELIFQKLDGFEQFGISLAGNQDFLQKVAVGDWQGAIATLGDVPGKAEFIDRIFLADARGTVLADLPRLEGAVGQNQALTDWYQGVSQKWAPYVSEVYQRSVEPRVNVVNIAVPIATGAYPSRQIMGVLVLQIRVESFSLWVQDLKLASGEYLFIVDHKGQSVYHPKFPAQGGITAFSSVPVVRRILDGKEGSDFTNNPFEKEKRFETYGRIENFGWGVVLTQPAHTAYAEHNKALVTVLLMYGLFFISIAGLVATVLWFFRKNKEHALILENTQQDLRLILDSTAEAIYGVDIDGRCTFCNPACLRLLGYSDARALLGEDMHRKVHHSQPDGALIPVGECRISKAARSGTEEHFEGHVFWRADGTSFPVEVWSYPQRRDGRLVGTVVTFIDITERERAEEVLRESEEKHRVLFESSHDALMTISPPLWKFTEANPVTLQLFGVATKQEFLAIGPWDVAPQKQPDGRDSGEKAKAMIETAVREGSHFFEWTHKRIDGKEFPATILLTRMQYGGQMMLQATVRDISEQKRRAEELQRSASFLMMSHDLAEIGSWEYDLATQTTVWSEKMFAIHGIAPQAGAPAFARIAEMVHPDDRDRWGRMIEDVVRTKMSQEIEFRIIRPDGECRWLHAREAAYNRVQEDRTYFYGVIRDITARRRTEEEIAFKNIILSFQAETSIDGILTVDEQGRVILANRRFAFMWNVPNEIMESRSDEKLQRHMGSFLAAPEAFFKRIQFLYANRHEKSTDELTFTGGKVFERYTSPMFDSDGKYYGRVWYFRDITAPRKMGESIRRSENQKRALLDNIPDLAWLKDKEGKYIAANESFSRACGVDVITVLGKTDADIWPPDVAGKYAVDDQEVMAAGQGKTLIEPVTDKEGKTQWFQTTRTPIHNEKGEIIGTAGIARDITVQKNDAEELRRAYEHLNAAKDQLVQSEKLAAIGQLAAGVAHEINNPMGFVASNLEMLEEYVAGFLKMIDFTRRLKVAVEKKDAAAAFAVMVEMREFESSVNMPYIISDSENLVRQSRDGVSRIKKIVADLSNFSRDEVEWTEELIKIEDVVGMALSVAFNELKYRIELRREYGPTPPVLCNTQKLAQVFLNLLMNAAQSIADKGVVEIRTYVKDGYLGVDIMDSGCGIPEENLNKIFDPFFTTKPAGKGTGLGLSISYELVKKQGGEITVRSTVGKGSVFSVMLPLSSKKPVPRA